MHHLCGFIPPPPPRPRNTIKSLVQNMTKCWKSIKSLELFRYTVKPYFSAARTKLFFFQHVFRITLRSCAVCDVCIGLREERLHLSAAIWGLKSGSWSRIRWLSRSSRLRLASQTDLQSNWPPIWRGDRKSSSCHPSYMLRFSLGSLPCESTFPCQNIDVPQVQVKSDKCR